MGQDGGYPRAVDRHEDEHCQDDHEAAHQAGDVSQESGEEPEDAARGKSVQDLLDLFRTETYGLQRCGDGRAELGYLGSVLRQQRGELGE